MNICDYRYYDKATHGLDWAEMIADLENAQAGDVVLFHGCCHNPTGIDPTPEQWATLAKMSAEKAGCRYSTLSRLCQRFGRRCGRFTHFAANHPNY